MWYSNVWNIAILEMSSQPGIETLGVFHAMCWNFIVYATNANILQLLTVSLGIWSA